MREAGSVRVAGGVEVGGDRLVELYEARGFRPLWSEPGAGELVRFVETIASDGLVPEHYHAEAAADMWARGAADASTRAEAELLYSHVFLQVAHDLALGRVDPGDLDQQWRVERPRSERLSPDTVARFIASGRVLRALDGYRPQHAIYRSMVQALATYRAIEARGGWGALPEGGLLELDSAGPAVPLLRRRLAVTGDLRAAGDTLSQRFDADLDAAVRRFQHRHGLNDDGVVGPATRRALDLPASERVRQLRANLERARWVLRDLEPTFVAVNVAGQRVYVVADDSVVLEMRAVVGREYTRTPVFTAPMRYLVLNPTWTVPRSINGEILASVRRDSTYLRRRGFEVLDGGRAIDPATVDFDRFSGGSFPYVFRQGPGPTNALGNVKFMFPNEFAVYLHDTPARDLFGREERLFSHGCIRVADPLGLATFLLPDWSVDELGAVIATGETRTVQLDRPVPVLVLYWTAATDLHGEVHFYRDIYDRDAALLDALDRPAR